MGIGIVELLQSMWGWRTGYPDPEAVRRRLLLALMAGWWRQILEAGAALPLPGDLLR